MEKFADVTWFLPLDEEQHGKDEFDRFSQQHNGRRVVRIRFAAKSRGCDQQALVDEQCHVSHEDYQAGSGGEDFPKFQLRHFCCGTYVGFFTVPWSIAFYFSFKANHRNYSAFLRAYKTRQTAANTVCNLTTG